MSKILLGPIISLSNDQDFTITVVVESQTNPKLNIDDGRQSIDLSNQIDLKSGDYLQFNFKVDVKDINQQIKYSIEDNGVALANRHGVTEWIFEVPAKHLTPRIYTCSCNGDGKVRPEDLNPEEDLFMWKKMRETHKKYPCHILVMTGDQVYADPLWETDFLKKNNHILKNKKKAAKFQLGTNRDTLKKELSLFYEKLYIEAWGHKDIAHMLASTPSVMIWDDHDIFDGYGSHGKGIQGSEIVKCIYEVASYYFDLFQSRQASSQVLLDDTKKHFAQHISYRNYEMFVLDGRAERDADTVCSEEQYKQLEAKLKGSLFQNGPYSKEINPKILCFVVSVPVAHYHYTKFLFRLARFFSRSDFRKDNKDDTIDQWSHKKHRQEQLKLINMVTAAAQRHNAHYAYFVSGDVHSAGAARAYGLKKISDPDGFSYHGYIGQIVASPIVHESPGRLASFGLRLFSRSKMKIKGCMIQFRDFGSLNREVINERNFVVLNKRIRIEGEQNATGLKAYLYSKTYPNEKNPVSGYNLPNFKQEKILD